MFDAIIIGAGISGLSNAYFLAKEGMKVCVLEKHKHIGGSIQNFKKHNTVFDSGAHYIGGLSEGQSLYQYFRYLNLFKDIEYKQLDINAYDIIKFGEEEFFHAQGFENFKFHLEEKFKNHSSEIKKYIEETDELCNSVPFYNPSNEIIKNNEEIYFRNYNNVLNSITKETKLQNVISGNNIAYGGCYDDTPFYVPALMHHGYIESSWRVVGGSGKIAESLANSIKKMGGEVKTNCKATSINLKDNEVSSVEIENGEHIQTKIIISSLHPTLTLDLLPEEAFKKSYINRINKIENTKGNFSLYITFKENSLPYINSNYYCYSSFEKSRKKFGESFFIMFPTDSMNQEFCKSAIVMTYMDFSEMKKWENTSVEKRGIEYEEFKAKKSEELLKYIEYHFPEIRKHIKTYSSSTPLTYRDYTGTPEGSVYGIRKKSNYYESLILPVTKIKNLYLSGQSVNIHGVHGTVSGAAILSAHLFGKDYLIKKIREA